MSNYYLVDNLRHFSPLVLVSGLDIPQDDQQAQFYNWARYTTECPITESSISQHPFLRTKPAADNSSINSIPLNTPSGFGEPIAGATEQNVTASPETTRELFYKFATRSSAFEIWNPSAYDVSRKTVPYLLNIQFTASRSDYILPPVKGGTHAPVTSSAATSILESATLASDQASIAPSINSIDEKRSIQIQRQTHHSLLSPLNPASDLYPDGLISERWIQKYLELTPCSFVSILSIDTSSSSKEHQQNADAALTKHINELKTQLLLRNIKLIVILVSDISPIDDSTLNDRVYYLRKNTGLAARTGLFFLPPPRTPGNIEVETLAEAVCQLAYNNAQEFYTGIAKRIRKRSKMISSGNTNSDKTKSVYLDDNLIATPLSHAAWDVRYQYKLAVMSEFRQELESAIKGYETTYEAAFEVFEAMHPLTETCTAQRWQEFRAFLDLVVYKIIKLYFYMGQGNHAYKKYQLHLTSVQSVLKQKGFDTSSYQVVLWKAALEQLIAELLDMTEGMLIETNCAVAMDFNPMVPGDNLPRSGYWYLNSATSLLNLVKEMNKKGDQSESQDEKFLKDPYFDNYEPVKHVIAAKYMLNQSFFDFSCGSVTNERSIAAASYQLGEALFLSEEYSDAYQHYKDAARMYRLESWSPLLNVVLKRMAETSQKLGNTEDQLLDELELVINRNKNAALLGHVPSLAQNDSVNGLSQMLDTLKISDTQETYIKLHEKTHTLKFYDASFAFNSRDCFLGLPAELQLALTCELPNEWYNDESKSSLFALQQVVIKIKGELGSIRIKHNPNLKDLAVVEIKPADLVATKFKEEDGSIPPSRHDSTITLSDESKVELEETEEEKKAKVVYESLVYECEANLAFRPNKMRVFQVSQIPKSLGEARFLEISAITKYHSLTFDMTILSKKETSGIIPWYFERQVPKPIKNSSFSFFGKQQGLSNNEIFANHIRNPNPHRLKLLPRPSLISIAMNTREGIASGEVVRRPIWISNSEKENVLATVQAKAITDKGDAATIRWLAKDKKNSNDLGDILKEIVLSPEQSIFETMELVVPSTGVSIANITIEFFISYHPVGTNSLLTKKEGAEDEELMLIRDVVSHKLDVLKPFAVYSDVLPRVHPDPWPSMFDPDSDDNLALFPKIWKRWELTNVLQCTLGADFKGCIQVIKTELEIDAVVENTNTNNGQPRSATESKKEPDIMCKVVSKLDCENKLLTNNGNEKFSYIFDATRKSNEHDVRGGKLEAKIKIYWRRVPEKSSGDGESDNINDEDIVNVYRAPTVWPTILLLEPRLIVTLKRAQNARLASSLGPRISSSLIIDGAEKSQDSSSSAAVSTSSPLHDRAIKVTYYIENSTAHMLTYSATMGASDIFAYQGPKQLTIRMLPFSRRAVQYIMYPLTRSGSSIGRTAGGNANNAEATYSTSAAGGSSTLTLPQLRVYDVFYKRTLQQIAASKGLRNDQGKLLMNLY